MGYWILLRLGVFKPFFSQQKSSYSQQDKKESKGKEKRLSNFLLSVYFDPFSRLLCKKYKNTLECARSKPKADDSSWTLLIPKLSLFLRLSYPFKK